MTLEAWGPSQVLETSSQWPLLSHFNPPTLAQSFPVPWLGISIPTPYAISLFFSLGFSPAACLLPTSVPVPVAHPLALYPGSSSSPIPWGSKSQSCTTGPLSHAPCPSTYVLLTNPGWQTFFHSLKLLTSNLGFLPPLVAFLHPTSKHVQPQHLRSAIGGKFCSQPATWGLACAWYRWSLWRTLLLNSWEVSTELEQMLSIWLKSVCFHILDLRVGPFLCQM